MKEEKDGEVEVNSLYEAFQFEFLESGFNFKIGKGLLAEYSLKLFPNAKRER